MIARAGLFIAAWLLGGVVISACVAWGIQCWSYRTPPNRPYEEAIDPSKQRYWAISRGFGRTFSWAADQDSVSDKTLPRPRSVLWSDGFVRRRLVKSSPTTKYIILVYAYGWPWRCFSSVLKGNAGQFNPRQQTTEWWRGPCLWIHPSGTPLYLAVVPEPTGLLACSLLYGWIPLALVGGPGFVRRARRRRAGRCLHCGYDLGGITVGVCPECGHVSMPASAGFPRSG